MTYPVTQPIQNKLFSESIVAIKEIGLDPELNTTQKMAEIMYRTLLFSKSLVWQENEHVFLVRTPQELLEIYKLRNTVFLQVSYGADIPGDIKGLNFDPLDECSAIVYTKSTDTITGTCRIIFDNSMHLPAEKTYSFEYIKKEGKQIAELSRLAILRTEGGLNQDFKYLVRGAYNAMVKNDMDVLVSVMIPENHKLYKRLGGFKILKELDSYIGMQKSFVVTAWEVAKISSRAKKLFLGIKEPNPTSKGRDSLDQLNP